LGPIKGCHVALGTQQELTEVDFRGAANHWRRLLNCGDG
jgi:hypothetical protein